MEQLYQCPNCGYPVAFAIRFCSNCGTALDWSAQQTDHDQHKRMGAGYFTFIKLAAAGVFICILIIGGLVAYDLSSRSSISSATPMSQSQPQSEPQSEPEQLPLATPVLLSPGENTDPGRTIDTITPLFKWNAVPGADYYSVTISRFPYDSDNTICTPPDLSGTSLEIPDRVLEYGQKYRWSIVAHSNTSPSSVSNSMYFQTPEIPSSLLSDSTATEDPEEQPDSTPASPSAPPWTPVTLPGWTST